MKKQRAVNLEHALQELETLVSRLEAGDQDLAASLTLFERGITLTRQCQQALDEAQQTVDRLVGDKPTPLTPPPSPAAPDTDD